MKMLFSLVVFAFVSPSFGSDLLVVRGGREIHGRFLEESKTHVTFYTDYGKKIQVHKSRVSVLLRDGEVLAVTPVVGSVLGIKADTETGKAQANVSGLPKMEEPSKTIEPVTQNTNSSKSDEARQVASVVTTESIPTQGIGLKVGATVGMIQSNASTDTTTQSRIGAEGGVVAEIPFLGQLHLQPELLLSQSGYKTGGAVYKYSFMRVPLLVKYRYPLSDAITLVGMAGPSLGFRSEAKSELDGISTDIKATTKSTIIGADFGLGTEYSLTANLGLFLNVRYSMQLNNLDTTVGATTPIKLRQLSFLSGFLFAL